MSYLSIEDFKGGLDTRRLAEASAPGSLQQIKNAQINRGGEIEKAKAWVSKYSLPADTFSLAASSGGLYIFGSIINPSPPAGVTYQRLLPPDSNVMESIESLDTFSGQLYVVANYTDDTQYHFYNGDVIPDWYTGLARSSMVTLSAFATELAALADTDDDVSATSLGAVITITANVIDTPFTISATIEDGGIYTDQTVVVATPTPGSGGNAQVSTVTLGGTFDPGDKVTIIINDNYYGSSGVTNRPVTSVITHKNKVYATSDVNTFFSGVAEPTGWRPQFVGSGVIDMSAQASNEEELTALGIYQNSLVVFGRGSAQIWSMDADPDANVQLQVLDNVGTRSPKSVVSFGDSDVFFLSDFGIRSLRARDSSNSAGITDVGTPIDDIIISAMDTLTEAEIKAAASAIEPQSGRYIHSLGDKMYVFSFFPSSKISAWSTWEPGFTITDFASLSGRLYGRSEDTIYLLGGDDNDEYTEEEVVIEMPYLDARQIATWKRWTGVDMIVEGRWDVYVNTNPRQPDEWVKTATVFETSIGQMKLAMQQWSPVLKFKFVHQDTGPAKISKIIVHYEASRARQG